MESNYEKQVLMARKLFLNYDQEKMIRKFHLDSDEQWIYLEFLNRIYRISRRTGEIFLSRCLSGDKHGGEDSKNSVPCMDYQIVMTLYDVLCYSAGIPVLSREWCPIYALQVTMSSPGTDTFTGKYAKLFSGDTERLRCACEKLGGEQPGIVARADVCWQFRVFPFFSVQLRFWDGDDEFEPKLQLLWDRNSLDFMHFETLYYVQGHLMERLKEEFEEISG